MTPMRIAVTGQQGQLAQSLAERGPGQGATILLAGRPDLDLSRPESVYPALAALAPDVVVNAAAYTAVDKAESDAEEAMRVNGAGAGAVAAAAARLGVPLVHVSTDYVFDGALDRPWREDDPTGPTGVYGASKLEGERQVLAAARDSVILRTAWVYSPFGKNFARTMLTLAKTREELGVVDDQRGSPTSALSLADMALAVARNVRASTDPALRGVFHAVDGGDASWAEFAAAIFEISAGLGGPSARVRRIATAEYPTPARRPVNSRLDTGRLAARHKVTPPQWREALAPCVARLIEQDRSGS